MTIQGIGLEFPSRSLGATHLVLVALLVGSGLTAGSRARRLLLALGCALVVILPVVWVGPLWSDVATSPQFALGFLTSFFLGLGIPFALAAIAGHLMGRRANPAGPLPRAILTVVAYLVGLLASYPVSLNYALLYPLLR